MNGARTTLMRKGYLLTALAAAVLLASSGTALAQVTDIDIRSIVVDGANSAGVVGEGTASNVTVTLNKAIPVGATGTVTISLTGPDGTTALAATGARGAAEENDISLAATTIQIVGGNSSGSVPIVFSRDLDAVDEGFRVNATALTVDPATLGTPADTVTTRRTPASGKIDDTEEQTYSLTVNPAASYMEGTPFDLTLRAVPNRPENEGTALVFGVTRGYLATSGGSTLSATTGLTLDNANTSHTINVGLSNAAGDANDGTNDRNRTDDLVTVTAHQGTAVQSTELAMAEVTLVDIHQLPAAGAIVGEARDNMRRDLGEVVTSVTEGDTTYVWVDVVGSARDNVLDAETLTVDVTVAPAQALDARVTRPGSMTDRQTNATVVATPNWIGPWVVEVENDQDVGMEMLMLSLDVTGEDQYGGGSSSGSFSIDIVDATEKMITPKHSEADYDKIKAAIAAGAGEEGLNPGEMVELMTSDLFEVAEGYTASYGVSVDSDAVSAAASGDTITITAMKAGMAHVYVTGTARMSSSLEATQTVSNVAELKFPVEVVDKELMVTLEMPSNVMDGNIVEGSSYEIGVMANRMITEAEGSVEVMIMRDRSQSDADDSDFTVSSATIMAGYDSATAELMVTEDMEPDSGTNDNMGEQLVLYGMAG
ncbi:MAG: hypothetical protein OXQ29_25750, partial [Rhodospirillaceae bacterium]|nr:hypothetical protein [Rhodospirillaceae bacterium]